MPSFPVRRRSTSVMRPIRLVPISVALGITLALAASAAGGLILVAVSWLGVPNQVGKTATLAELLEVVKISLAVVAGVGGVIALVVAYRKQRITEAGETREQTKLYAERFDKAADKLGSDSAAVRLAGIHALAALADDWPGGRQMCIDVLCAYLRMPPQPKPVGEDDPAALASWQSMAEVRATALRLIATHLRAPAPVPWRGCDFDFTSIDFTSGADFTNTQFSGGEVSFRGAKFSGGTVFFDGAKFSGGIVSFDLAQFSGGRVSFYMAQFSGGTVSFEKAQFSAGNVTFYMAQFSGGRVSFYMAQFSGGRVTFEKAQFSGGAVTFSGVANWTHPPSGLPSAAAGLYLPSASKSWPDEEQVPAGP